MVGRDQTARDSAREIPTGCFCECGSWKGAFGLEPTIEMYVEHTVQILREIRKVLRKDGVVFWNIGDSYASQGGPQVPQTANSNRVGGSDTQNDHRSRQPSPGLKPKDACLIPFRVALAVQADGWWVRSDIIIWSKPNPMPEAVTDRPTKSHEYIFVFTKSKDYYFDADAVREENSPNKPWGRASAAIRAPDRGGDPGLMAVAGQVSATDKYHSSGRNIRSVWEIATQPYPEAHFATFPEEIPRRCIKAGTSEKGCCPACGAPWERIIEKEYLKPAERTTTGNDDYVSGGGKSKRRGGINDGTFPTGLIPRTIGWKPGCTCPRDDKLPPVPCLVLDPFAGSGTTLRVARDLGRHAIGIDISNEYKELAKDRALLNYPDICNFKSSDDVHAVND